MRKRWWLLAGVLVGVVSFTGRWLNGRPFQGHASAAEAAPAPRSVENMLSPLVPPPVAAGATRPVVKPSTAADSGPAVALAEKLNVLLVGLDRRPGATSGGRPDTIIVASFDASQGQVGLVSIPRDLYVEIPGYGFDRINATAARAAQSRRDPTRLLQSVVETTLGISIQHSVVIDLAGFERAIDAVGGVDVHVSCPIADNFIDPRRPGQRRSLDLDAGWQHLDGPTAAMFVRSRHGRSDWSRSRRQQAVLAALKRRLLSFEGITRVPALLDELQSVVETDMSRAEILRLAALGVRVEPDRVHGLVIGYRETEGYMTPDGKAVLRPKLPEIRAKVAALFEAKAPGTLPEHSTCAAKEVALQHRSTSFRPAKGQAGAPGSD